MFRNWKDLSQPFKPIKHIKKNPIEEILFEATYVNGKRTVKVSYKLIEQQEYHEVAILKRGREFPEPGVLAEDKLPPEAGWKKLGSKRHKGLLKSLDSISGEVTDEIFQFYADLPHKTEEEEEAEAPRRRRVDRGGNPVEVPAQPAVAAPHVNSSPSLDQSPPHIEPSSSPIALEPVANVRHAPPAKDDVSVPPDSSAEAMTDSDDEASDEEMEEGTTFSRSMYLSMLAPDNYDKSSRYLRNVASLGRKRRRKEKKDDDFLE